MDLKLWLKERELNARQIASRKTIADRSVWIEDANYFNAAYDAIQRAELQGQKPIDMVLHCPACGMQHVDAPDERTPGWVNEPHRSHLCHDCGHVWRPSDVPTNGVAAVKTKGKADSPVAQAPNAQQAEPASGNWIAADDYRKNVKDLDVALNGPGGAERPALIDVLSQVEQVARERGMPVLVALAQQAEPPPWWPAVENILNEYGLQAVDFVADFKAAQQAEAQEPVATINISDDDFDLGLTDDYAFGIKRLPNGEHQLFTRPQPAQLQALSYEEIDAAVAPLYKNSAAQRMGRIDDLSTAKVIQSALAAKNVVSLK